MAEEPLTAPWPALEIVPTGIAGLDAVLRGGLVRGGIYLVGGRPGTGKTTLGNHLAYNHARAGGTALFVTVMAEVHDRMLAHLRGFHFLDALPDDAPVPYLNIYDELMTNGLDGVVALLRRLIREHRATLVVVDGARLFEDFAATPHDYRRFTHQLQTQLALLGCTAILLSDNPGLDGNPIGTHVDGILILEDQSHDLRDVRFLHVVKTRGVDCLRGRHSFAITAAGIEVYPRLEAVLTAEPPVAPHRGERVPLGVAGLDDMLRGGLPAGLTTLILGAPGAGKTITGLHFLAEGARRGEAGLFVGFHETPPRLLAKAAGLGLDLGRQVDAGRVHLLWQPPLEVLLDAWAHRVLAAVAAHRARRLFVDGITDVQRLALFPERLPAFLAAFTNELRARDVTVLLAAETNTLISLAVEVPLPAISATVENTILLRYVELRSQLHRLVSILKVRESDYDSAIRAFRITGQGIAVDATFDGAEAVLTGVARPAPPGATTAVRQSPGLSGRAGP